MDIMRIAIFLTALFAPLLVHSQVISERSDQSDLGGEIVHRTIIVQNLDGSSQQLLQVVRRNDDGSLTIVPHAQTPEYMKYHEDLCAQLGGVDTTNEGVHIISAETIDGSSCHMPLDQPLM
jgi:hypothetical protein